MRSSAIYSLPFLQSFFEDTPPIGMIKPFNMSPSFRADVTPCKRIRVSLYLDDPAVFNLYQKTTATMIHPTAKNLLHSFHRRSSFMGIISIQSIMMPMSPLKFIFDKMFTPLEIMPHCSTAGLHFRIIPGWFNARLEFLTGFTCSIYAAF